MASPEVLILPGPARAILYTGSNSADIDAQVPGVSIISETGGVLTLSVVGGNNVTLNTNDWVAWNALSVLSLNQNQYSTEWACVPSCADFSGLESSVDGIDTDVTTLQGSVSGAFVRATGVAPVPTLLLGQDTTVAVTLQPAMPDSSFSAYAVTFGGVNLADLDITSVSVVDTDTVNVAVDNVGLGTVSGVTVMVHAID